MRSLSKAPERVYISLPSNNVVERMAVEGPWPWCLLNLSSNKWGFVVTGEDASRHPDFEHHWTEERQPYLLETTRPGIFAVGDVRSGSTKRVASAVGEGSMAVTYVHQVLT